jgi:hypothetical protein
MENKSRFFAISLVALMSSLFILGCDNNDEGTKIKPPQVATKTFSAHMTGANEVPSDTSSATGDANASFNTSTKVMMLTVNYDGITPTAAHIHKGAVGQAGDVVFPITTTLSNPFTFTTPALTAAQEADLNAGLYYIDLHSDTYPDGEIRGQLLSASDTTSTNN